MIETRVWRAGFGGLSGVALCLGLLVVRSWARVGTVLPPSATPPGGEAVRRAGDSAPVVALGALVAHDPLRARRAPSRVVYDPVALAAGPSAPPPPKPALVLTGIAWGAEPEAVIEGLPGTDGPRVVHQGDMIGPLHVKWIAPKRVVIVGMDTTWTLTVREPWK